MTDFPLWPQQASSFAGQVDALFIFMCIITGTVSLLVFVVIFWLAIKYRRTPQNELAQDLEPPKMLEAAWIIIPFFIFMGMFVWGSWLYFRLSRVPDNALDIYATGKQWMWKFQHPTGQREINTLHVPVGRPVRITMASEDVIHSLFFPNFRTKADVLPNRYRVMWFQATRTGRYHIFCAEYCGTLHSGMIGWVDVMEATDYQRWLAGGAEGSLASQGEKLFQKYACNTCHTNDATARGPMLVGLYGSTVTLSDDATLPADENYIRESILNPQAKIVKGFQPLMPTFQGQMNEDDLMKLLAYVKSLAKPGTPASSPAGPAASPPPSVSGRRDGAQPAGGTPAFLAAEVPKP
jgi:cytochrome c oxidase subunit 2